MVTRGEFTARYIEPFTSVDYIYDQRGFIVWRRGTGDNVELLHIRTFELRKGYGYDLVREMVERLKVNPPRHCVFGFTWAGNREASAFYGALGFTLCDVSGVYANVETILFHQRWVDLCERMGSNG
jgi:GNAT superfamily N-acetyltransferase